MLAKSPPDAVILDIGMPRLDGLEVCRRMRQAGDRTPILMLTARDAIDDRVEGLDVGADDYLVKPFALRELQARLRALLRRSGDGDRRRGPPLRRHGARPGRARGPPRRPRDRAVQDRVPAAGAVHAPPTPGADPFDDLRERVGIRLRPDFQRARRVHGIPAPQDRSRRRAASPAHGARASATCSGTERERSVAAQETRPGGRLGRRVAVVHRRDRLLHGRAQPAARQVDSELQGAGGGRQQDGQASLGQAPAGASAERRRAGASTYQLVRHRRGDPRRHLSCRSPARVQAVAAGTAPAFFSDITIGGSRLPRAHVPGRSATGHRGRTGRSPARPAPPAASTTCSRKLRLVLLLVCAAGIALAALLGRLAARQVLAPLAEVAGTARHIEETEDLSSRHPRPRRRRGRASSPPASTR